MAEALGKHLHEIRRLPCSEVVEWQAFFSWRQKVTEYEMKKARARRGDA